MTDLQLVQAYIATRHHTNTRGERVPETADYLGDALVFSETEAQLLLGLLTDAVGDKFGYDAGLAIEACKVLRDKLLTYLPQAQVWQDEQAALDRYEQDLEHGKLQFSDRDEATGIPKSGPL